MRLGPVHNFLLIATLLTVTGCVSATKRIATQTNKVTQQASEISDTADRALSSLDNPPASMPLDQDIQAYLGQQKSYWLSAKENANDIVDGASKISEDLTGVSDTVPWWATLLKLLAGFGMLALTLAALWYTGILKALQKIVWSLGYLIPDAKKAQAKLDAEAYKANPTSPELSAAIARQRADDPAYNAAYMNLKK